MLYSVAEAVVTTLGLTLASDLRNTQVMFVGKVLGLYTAVYLLHRAAQDRWGAEWLELVFAATLTHTVVVLGTGWLALAFTPSTDWRWLGAEEWAAIWRESDWGPRVETTRTLLGQSELEFINY